MLCVLTLYATSIETEHSSYAGCKSICISEVNNDSDWLE